jgi:predicted CopG family antitoxin
MPGITVTVDDEVYRRALVHAARAGTSVSALVRACLESLCERDVEFGRLEALQDAAITEARDLGTFSAANRLTRDEVTARAIG